MLEVAACGMEVEGHAAADRQQQVEITTSPGTDDHPAVWVYACSMHILLQGKAALLVRRHHHTMAL
jgi:hypothetical protein